MKEILAKLNRLLKRIICLFKLTISCKFGFGDKDDEIDDVKEEKK